MKWSVTLELPYLHLGKAVLVTIKSKGMVFSLKDVPNSKQAAVPWEKILPFKPTIYRGEEGDPVLDFASMHSHGLDG